MGTKQDRKAKGIFTILQTQVSLAHVGDLMVPSRVSSSNSVG